jgi:hypothetical protein
MGVTAGRAVGARRREAATRASRLVSRQAQVDEVAAGGAARRNRAVREVRRWLRSGEAALRRAQVADERAGAALVRLAAQGTGLGSAAAAAGLTRATARRLVAAASSTGQPTDTAGSGAASDPELRPVTSSRAEGGVDR